MVRAGVWTSPAPRAEDGALGAGSAAEECPEHSLREGRHKQLASLLCAGFTFLSKPGFLRAVVQ